MVAKGGRIGLFIATPGQSNIQPRIDGAQSALKGKGYKIDVITTGADLPGELTKIDAYVQGHPDVKGLFAVDAGSTQGIAQTMQKRGLQAKGVKGGGYDLLPITLELIKSGDLDFTIDQQPYLQGFQPVIQLFLYKISGGLMAPSNTNTGLLFVTLGNVDPYLRRSRATRAATRRRSTSRARLVAVAAAESIERRPAGAGRRIASHVIARREFGIFLVLVGLILVLQRAQQRIHGTLELGDARRVRRADPARGRRRDDAADLRGDRSLRRSRLRARAARALQGGGARLAALGRPRHRPRGGGPGRADERPHHRLPARCRA